MMLEGHYAKKQILCSNQIIAWSHSSRFQTTKKLLEIYVGSNSKLLDYGCGDGTFLQIVSHLVSEAVGTDIAEGQIYNCQQRFSGETKIKFSHIKELSSQQSVSYFDTAVCMEVLEHCLAEQVEKIIKDLNRLVKPEGIIIISVPIEIGLSLLIKQITRRIAGYLRQGEYDKSIEPYSLTELLQMIFATKSSSIKRPVYGDESPYHGHKGFNWRLLREELSKTYKIEHTCFSPLGWLGGFFSSQVFLICRNKKP
ncbi:class I SAM-dependent methyltransferase [Sphaerospermopsis aphanizomenoides BCCUSP55]|uniref:class I SAM-dependent methyltransferase n=1 Tax=Sphaerospermopsis aphanizomenoides TaxID=459663 RepID=UPI001903BC13|nr:class I SAM-dependent methyltransferase [Sphaerospermopsis aphanizomenoides]MBK1988956.1 class I SAM-dependent methyltransferase [Sphaerospermopsis aphanizomenoides BCCUSP55]